MTTIQLHNTKTRKREEFVPIDPKNVRMYVCGPTVYDRAHLGNARPVLVFDVLYRLLRHVYGADHVTYVRNFTDVDDRINETAQKRKAAGAQGTLEELIHERSDETIRWYHDDMDVLGALRPDHEPRATEYIAQMVAMIEGLIAKGHAYEAEGHVLFAVDSWKEHYGSLSGRSVDDMIAGARVEVAPYKRNPMDFVLWKPSPDDLPGWPGPVVDGKSIGKGRPGWHIECSAMAHELLGAHFDIHGGGNDLMFPHHENEIAQSCCANDTEAMANVWMHNEMLQVEGKKMSKSLGNFFTVRDLLDQGVPGEVIRFVMLSTHYRKPMDWTEKKREEAEKFLRQCAAALEEWYEAADSVGLKKNEPAGPTSDLLDALANDLNTSKALTHLRILASQAMAAPWDFGGKLYQDLKFLGFLDGHLTEWFSDNVDDLAPLAKLLSKARSKAKDTKDFSEVDRLKTALIGVGLEVQMSKNGVKLFRKKLESINSAYARANRAVATDDDDEANFWYGIAEQMKNGTVPCRENQEHKIQALIAELKL
jgi:cysteinyl-tRNA synthetase